MLVFIYLFLHNDLAGTKYDQLKESLFWIILFGPWLFPLSLIIWHAYQLSQGETNFMKFENVARSRVLNSLSVLTKSAVQAGLYILTHSIEGGGYFGKDKDFFGNVAPLNITGTFTFNNPTQIPRPLGQSSKPVRC